MYRLTLTRNEGRKGLEIVPISEKENISDTGIVFKAIFDQIS